MTRTREASAQIKVGPDGRFAAPVRLFRHSRYSVQRQRDGQLIFTPVPDSAFPPKEETKDE